MPARSHDWSISISEARSIQEKLSQQVIRHDELDTVKFIAGVDVGFKQKGKITQAAIVILSFPSLEYIEHQIYQMQTQFPYIPGYLSFREIPAIYEALQHVKHKPDLIICDGQGIAHPRRFGLACHLGVITNIPTIGAAKSRLIGTHEPVDEKKGRWVPLYDKDEKIGAVLRTRDRVKPLYISIGHKVSLETALHYVMASVTRYRLPETTRWADRLASEKS